MNWGGFSNSLHSFTNLPGLLLYRLNFVVLFLASCLVKNQKFISRFENQWNFYPDKSKIDEYMLLFVFLLGEVNSFHEISK